MPSLIGNVNGILKGSEMKIDRPVIGLTMYGLNQDQRYSIPHDYIKSIVSYILVDINYDFDTLSDKEKGTDAPWLVAKYQ